jgi:hypothetical protein
MRLSDAIVLGRTLANGPVSHIFYDPFTNCACARGMACLAIGRQEEAGHAEREVWKWVNREGFALPCGCGMGPTYAWSVINHLMCHVTGMRDGREFPATWTIDQLIDWVRSVEPQEAEAPPSVPEAVAESVVKCPQ